MLRDAAGSYSEIEAFSDRSKDQFILGAYHHQRSDRWIKDIVEDDKPNEFAFWRDFGFAFASGRVWPPHDLNNATYLNILLNRENYLGRIKGSKEIGAEIM